MKLCQLPSNCIFPSCCKIGIIDGWCMFHHVTLKVDDKKNKYWKEYHSLYKNVKWLKLRRLALANQPTCVECEAVANEVDHITDHKGDLDLFYELDNLQSLCKSCHSRKTMQDINSRDFPEIPKIINITISNDDSSDIDNYMKWLSSKDVSLYIYKMVVKNKQNNFTVKDLKEANYLMRYWKLEFKQVPRFEVKYGNKEKSKKS